MHTVTPNPHLHYCRYHHHYPSHRLSVLHIPCWSHWYVQLPQMTSTSSLFCHQNIFLRLSLVETSSNRWFLNDSSGWKHNVLPATGREPLIDQLTPYKDSALSQRNTGSTLHVWKPLSVADCSRARELLKVEYHSTNTLKINLEILYVLYIAYRNKSDKVWNITLHCFSLSWNEEQRQTPHSCH